MQQTETYKFNLIETSDTFSPDPLNQNTQKLEQVLSAEAAQRSAETAALDSRVTALEIHKVAVGTYVGNSSMGTSQTIQLGFTPKAVMLEEADSGNTFMALPGMPFCVDAIVVIDGGFRVSNNSSVYANYNGRKYVYLAIK